MMSRTVRTLAIAVCAAGLLSGCSTFDFMEGWFKGGPEKSKLKGERISVMALDESLKPDATLASTNVVLPPPYRNDDWANPGGYASNAMYHLEATGPLHQIWLQEVGKGSDKDSRLTAPPIVVGNAIYALDAAAHVFAFDTRSGKPLWDKSLAPEGEESILNTATLGMFGKNTSVDPSKGAGGGLASDGGKIFVSTGFGDVFALNPSGKQLWKINLGVPIVNAPVASGGMSSECGTW